MRSAGLQRLSVTPADSRLFTSQAGVSKIPTLMQAGYATGLAFILPLGDMMPIRAITLGCIGFTAILWSVLNFGSFRLDRCMEIFFGAALSKTCMQDIVL